MEREILTVSQLNGIVKGAVESEPRLSVAWVRGEISNCKRYPSGHWYFSLKDEESSLRCIMFKREAASLKFIPENGMKLLALGRVSVFPRDGQYQLYCSQLEPDGLGALYLAFEQLKEKLRKEGLFDENHKKPLPRFPERIAVITSGAGAAVHDIIQILGKRWPLSKVIVLPVRVQGAEAPPELCGAIRYVNKYRVADLIITGRGGGSMEDLWAFNDERLAREIFRSEIPVISAVGHEPDFTISDFVADRRAATPSNAAELAVPDINEIMQLLDSSASRMERAQNASIRTLSEKLAVLSRSRAMQSPLNYISDRRQTLLTASARLDALAERRIAGEKERFVRLCAALDALSPLKVLGRGYSIVRTDRGIVKSVRDVFPGDRLDISLTDGTVKAEAKLEQGEDYERQ